MLGLTSYENGVFIGSRKSVIQLKMSLQNSRLRVRLDVSKKCALNKVIFARIYKFQSSVWTLITRKITHGYYIYQLEVLFSDK